MTKPIIQSAKFPASAPEASRDLYIDLMKRVITHSLWYESEDVGRRPRGKLARLAYDFLVQPDLQKKRPSQTTEKKIEGRTWPQFAHTMIGFPRLDNLEMCVRSAIENEIPGDLIETGVWRGGACIFMRAILKAYGITDRAVWVADSFRGLPPPNPKRAPADANDKLYTYHELAISLQKVKSHFQAYGLLDSQVQFLEGWFRDTLPSAPMKQLAVCRLDGDMYESTMDGLVNLYPKLSPGGYLIVDDYGAVEACRKAVHDYRDQHAITEEIHPIDWTGVYWQRQR
jgi:O-methyltransferase